MIGTVAQWPPAIANTVTNRSGMTPSKGEEAELKEIVDLTPEVSSYGERPGGRWPSGAPAAWPGCRAPLLQDSIFCIGSRAGMTPTRLFRVERVSYTRDS
jgi:hypothetical protein